MKKILLSLSMIAIVGVLSAGATGAFFSDTETSTGNTFTAGAIDLKIDSVAFYNGEPVATSTWELKDLNPTADKFFDFGDVKPGDVGTTTISLHVINNEAWACAAVSGLTNFENGQTEPEAEVDLTVGVNEGELQQTMLWTVWKDDGDGVLEGGETILATGNPTNGVLALYDSTTVGGPLLPAETAYLGVAWTLPASSGNETQTDSMVGDISFEVVQSRNNANFVCGGDEEEPAPQDIIVNADDLATTSLAVINNPSKWLFYNDTNDTVMTINQFSGDGGVNDIVAGPDSVGAAQMTLHEATARYNIATYKYANTNLGDIGTLQYRLYDDSASSETPYLHFNVSLDGVDNWQNRLVQVPTGIVTDTWTTVDALAGMWTKSGGNWPVGVNTAVPFAGSTPRTWADIIADYPSAKVRATDSFFGIRVGHPGPDTENSFVDWVNFDGEVTDFEA